MEGSGRNKLGIKGITLVEMLVGMIVFMLFIGMTSRLLSTATSYPFLTYPVDPWLNYMEEITNEFRQLPDNLVPGTFRDPFPTIEKPIGVVRMKMTITADSNIFGLMVAQFHLTSIHEKTYRWRSYRFRQ